jgi:hypothetical protein
MGAQFPSNVAILSNTTATSLVFGPRYNPENPLAPSSGRPPMFAILPRVGNKNQFKMVVMKSTNFAAKKINGVCDQSDKNGNASPTSYEVIITGNLYRYRGTICAADFVNLCNVWQTSQYSLMENPAQIVQDPKLQAILALILETMRNDWANYILFAKEGFAVDTSAGAAPFYVATLPVAAADVPTTIGGSNGFWAQVDANVTAGLTPFVSTNDGTAAGNGINPANITGLLDRMIDAGSIALQGLIDNAASAEAAPYFLLDKALFNALQKFNAQVGSDNAWVHGREHQRYEMYRGYRVYKDMDAANFDTLTGSTVTSTIGGVSVKHSRNLRAVLMPPLTLQLGLDVRSEADEAVGMIVQNNPDRVNNPGAIDYSVMFSAGVGIAFPDYMVAGWASSQTFA